MYSSALVAWRVCVRVWKCKRKYSSVAWRICAQVRDTVISPPHLTAPHKPAPLPGTESTWHQSTDWLTPISYGHGLVLPQNNWGAKNHLKKAGLYVIIQSFRGSKFWLIPMALYVYEVCFAFLGFYQCNYWQVFRAWNICVQLMVATPSEQWAVLDHHSKLFRDMC